MLNELFWAQRQIMDAASTASSSLTTMSGTTASQSQQRVQELEMSVEKLRLVCHAMWGLVRDKTGLTEEELFQRVQDLDLQDGTLDGKLKRTCKQCPRCQRTVSARHAKCIYCGTEIIGETAFDQT